MPTKIKNVETGEVKDAYAINVTTDGSANAVVFDDGIWRNVTIQTWGYADTEPQVVWTPATPGVDY